MNGKLIDKYIPRYDVRARFATEVRAPADVTLATLRRMDLFRSRLVRSLFELRRLPTGRADGCVISSIRSVPELELIGAVLEEIPGREIVFGLIGRFWDLRDPMYRTLRPTEFAAFAEPGWAKAVVTLRAEPIDARTTRLITETRVAATDPGSRRRFGIYWAVIERFSGLIRLMWLRAMRGEAERAALAVPSLIDRYMPGCDVRTRYSIRVRAPAAETYAALRGTDLFAPLAIRVLFALRVLPSRIGRRPRRRVALRTLDDLARGGALLAEDPGRELAFGVIGRFWALRGRSHHPVVAETFASFAEPGVAKAVMSFTVDPIDDSTSQLVTETRVACTDPSSRRIFRVYWALIGPFSGVTRKAWLAAVRDTAERRAAVSNPIPAIPSPRVTAQDREG